jgi:hypothetical protein
MEGDGQAADGGRNANGGWKTFLLPAHCLGWAIASSIPSGCTQLEAWGRALRPTFTFKIGSNAFS